MAAAERPGAFRRRRLRLLRFLRWAYQRRKAATPFGRSNEIHAKQRQVDSGGSGRYARRRSAPPESVEQYNLNDRVQLDLGFLPRERIAKYVNEALACAYLPVDEDSVGYVDNGSVSVGERLCLLSAIPVDS